MKKLLLLFIPALLFLAASPFETSKKFTIEGKVLDQVGEKLIGVSIFIKGTTGGVITDFDGKFSLKSKDSCTVLVIMYTGFETLEQAACSEVENEFIIKEDIALESIVVMAYHTPLIEKDNTTQGKVLTSDDIKSIPTRDVSSLASHVAGVSSREEGSDVVIRGSRSKKSYSMSPGIISDAALGAITVIASPRSTPASKATHSSLGYAVESVRADEADRLRGRVEGILIEKSDEKMEVYAPIVEVPTEEIKTLETIESTDEDEHFSAGQLTASEWSDLQNWSDWQNTANEDLAAMENIWKINPQERYSVIVRNQKGIVIPNTTVQLQGENGTVLWTAKSDNTGRAELWITSTTDKQQAVKAKSISVSYEGKTTESTQITTFEKGINTIKIEAECSQFNTTEILFVIDATGSMGDEIRYMQSELGDVINRVKKLDFVGELRTGSIFYRDEGEEYLLRTQDISANTEATLNFIAKQRADGGGDAPEAVEDAMEAAILNQKWSDDAVARIAFVLLDAPPHQTEEIKNKMRSLAKKAAAKGIRIVPVLASGSQSDCEYLMRAMALLTNSRFLFLTDDSGIGNAHAEPSVGAYNVVFLNDLLFRLIVEFSAYDTCKEIDAPNNQPPVTGNDNTFAAACYPIPANEYVFVNLEKDVDKMEIFDIQGQLLITKPAMAQGVSTVYIDNLPSGTYVFKFTKGVEVQTIRVSKV